VPSQTKRQHALARMPSGRSLQAEP